MKGGGSRPSFAGLPDVGFLCFLEVAIYGFIEARGKGESFAESPVKHLDGVSQQIRHTLKEIDLDVGTPREDAFDEILVRERVLDADDLVNARTRHRLNRQPLRTLFHLLQD